MNQLREFAQQKSEFEKLNAELVAISVDDQEHAHKVHAEILHRAFPVLSDPGAKVIREYGLLHSKGHKDEDIAIRTVVVIGPDGKEITRAASKSVMQYPHPQEVLAALRSSGR